MGLKEAYQKKMDARIKEVRADIAKLEARARGAGADAEIRYHRELKKLRAREEAVRDKLKELREAGDEKWEGLKAGVETSWDELKDAMGQARARFGK